jgi:hypothetical protein
MVYLASRSHEDGGLPNGRLGPVRSAVQAVAVKLRAGCSARMRTTAPPARRGKPGGLAASAAATPVSPSTEVRDGAGGAAGSPEGHCVFGEALVQTVGLGARLFIALSAS